MSKKYNSVVRKHLKIPREKETKSNECIRPVIHIFGFCSFFKLILRNVLQNVSQIDENKNCLGMFTVQ